jgi:hypothetical protein
MPYFACSLPNPGLRDEVGHLQRIANDWAELNAWAQKEDKPGRSVYRCVNPLLPGATRRALDTVAAIVCLAVDVDAKHIEEDIETIGSRLQQVPLPPTWIVFSGYGYHVGWDLRQPVERDDPEFGPTQLLLKRLTACLCGDPAPAHIAALLRYPGTHNTKYGNSVLCETRWEGGHAVDPSDIEAMLDLLQDEPLFTRKSNGNGHANGHGEGAKTPVDVEARLARMKWQGAGDTAINITQRDCAAKMLREGCSVEETVSCLLEATQKAVVGEFAANDWDWNAEKVQIEGMCFRHINKNHELGYLLPDYLRTRFEALAQEGKDPCVIRPFGRMWTVRANRTGPSEHNGSGEAGTEAPKAKDEPRKPGPRVILHSVNPADLLQVPPRQWLYGKHYQRRTVSATIAPGGVGKTSLVLVESIAMTTGRSLLGEQPTERVRVWLHNGEDDIFELRRRIWAVCMHYHIPPEELDGWLFVTSGADMPLKVAHGYNELKLDDALIREIAQRIGEHEIDVAGFDPLVTLHDSGETGNDRMGRVVRTFASIAQACDCAVELSHHTRKLFPGMTEYTVDDARGPSALRDAVRTMRVLNPMPEKDAEDAGIGELNRLQYFRVDRGKANTVARSSALVWRKFESVDLPNGDDVGVVTEWTPPHQGQQTPEKAAAERVAEEVFINLLTKFAARGTNVSVNVANNYAPTKFAAEKEAKLAKVSKLALKQAMGRLLDAGRIKSAPHGRSHRIVPCQEAAE